MLDSADRPGDPQCSKAGLRASRGPDALCAERRVGTGHGMRLPVPGNAYAAMASAIASATRSARSLSRGSTRWRLTREGRELRRARRSRFPRNQASGLVRPSLLARSCLRPRGIVTSATTGRALARGRRSQGASWIRANPDCPLGRTPKASRRTMSPPPPDWRCGSGGQPARCGPRAGSAGRAPAPRLGQRPPVARRPALPQVVRSGNATSASVGARSLRERRSLNRVR